MTTNTPPPVSGDSTPGFGDFMTGLTPGGFFSASYHLDNPFEKSFGESNPTYDTTSEPFSKSLQATAESNSIYGFPPTSNSFFNSPYPIKQEITPPQTASEPPADWQFGESLSGTQIAQTLINSLSVEGPSAHSKIQYGQATPPDEQSLREPGLDEVNSALSHRRPATIKREATSSNKSTKSVKRAKKVTRGSQMPESSPENSEEVEKRSKFLERNRVAASKCRQKKKEHNAQLEQKAKNLERDNAMLKMHMEALQSEKIELMTRMAMHTPENCDCHDIHQNIAHFKAKYNTTFGPDDVAGRSSDTTSLHARTGSVVSAAPTLDHELHD